MSYYINPFNYLPHSTLKSLLLLNRFKRKKKNSEITAKYLNYLFLRVKNRILQIKDPAGNTKENQMEIETILVEHFRNCFEDKTQANFHSVVQDLQALLVPSLSNQHRLLNELITLAEIENIVFQLGSHLDLMVF